MTAYSYEALSASGQRIKGVVDLDSERQVRQHLRDKGLMPVSLSKVATVSQRSGAALSGLSAFFHRIKPKELALFTRQLATLLAAGIALDEALQSVANQSERPRVKQIITAVCSGVLEGRSLASSMNDFPRSFPTLYTTTVDSGENSGQLDVVLEKMADHLDKQRKMAQKVQQALVYPIVMTVASLLVVVFLLTNVVPKIVTVFTDSGQTLPMATTILLAFSHVLAVYGWLILIVLVVGIFFLRRFFNSPKGQPFWHNFLLKLPVIKKLIVLINCARFSRTLSLLLSSGVPLLDAMSSSAKLVKPLPMRIAIDEAVVAVKEGSLIHKALKKTGFFPTLMLHLIASGESSGQLEMMLAKSAADLDADVEYQLQLFLTLFEPILIFVMGGVVLFIVLAIMLPIFALDNMPGSAM